MLEPRLDPRLNLQGLFVSDERFGPEMFSLMQPTRAKFNVNRSTSGGKFTGGKVIIPKGHFLADQGYLYVIVDPPPEVIEERKPGRYILTGPVKPTRVEIVRKEDVLKKGWKIIDKNQSLISRVAAAGEPELAYLLLPPGATRQIGSEKGRERENGISKYQNPYGSFRYVYFVDGEAVSALQVMSMPSTRVATIANVYTLPVYRRTGYARKLLQVARGDFDEVRHSPHDLSSAGSAWKTSVNG